jgi:serine/threonine-protein kinase
LEGERLGQFLLQQFVGGGGMGVVFRALDTTLNRPVAVKVLSRDQSADDEALRRFRNEAQSAARLNHENIARVHYVGEDRGVHYIVFEYIEGVNLRDRVEQNGPLPLEEAVSFTYQIAQALDHASERDVIHRDIKPSNVLITPDGKAKLVDMGLARLNQVAQADADLTASGVTLGTFDYISPEQARDPRSADVRSDMYSLGCSFFFMLTGRPPFPDGTVLQKLLQHQADHPPDPRAVRPDVPVEVTWILARMLAKNPAQRYQQPRELIDQLVALGEKIGLSLSGPAGAIVRPRPAGLLARFGHHLPWAVPLAALFLVVLALDMIWSTEAGEGQFASSPAVANPVGPAPHEPAPVTPVPPPIAPPRAVPDNPPPAPVSSNPTPGGKAAATSDVATPVGPSAADANDNPGENSTAPRQAGIPGGGLSIEELAARLSAAADAAARLVPQPAGKSDESGASGANGTIPADATQNAAGENQNQATPRTGVIVVSDSEQGPQIYSTLRAACEKAKTGDVIELRFTDRHVEEPITVSNMNLTIRAGEGFRPVVVFRPNPDPVAFGPSMVAVSGGQLHVSGVHWELDLPRDVHRDWTLFETRRADLLRFENCSFTIRNASLDRTAYNAGVAFFDIKAPPGGGSMAMDPAAIDDPPVEIDVHNCIVRGEAVLVRDNELQPLRLKWNNGLLATSERLLVATGGPTEPRKQGTIEIQLEHVTAMMQGGLALLSDSKDAPYQLATEIRTSDCILASTANSPLVEQRGSDNVEDYLNKHVQWQSDRVFFDGFEVFWKITNGATHDVLRQMDFDEWQEIWRSRSQSTASVPIGWKRLPSTNRPFHTHTPDDYELDNLAPDNQAVGASAGGEDAGLVGKLLGELPPEEAPSLPRRDANDATPRSSLDEP